jgi:PAS domain S-box-containing protein
MSDDQFLKILLIEDDPGDVQLIQELLVEVRQNELAFSHTVTHAKELGQALNILKQEQFDLILLDLSLPSSQGFGTIEQTLHAAPTVPVVVMNDVNDQNLALETVKAGAQDYLVKGQVDAYLLSRAIRYAIERARARTALRESEERYRRLVELSLEGIAVQTEGKFIFVNATAAKLLGASDSAELIGRSVFDFVHPDFRPIAQKRAQQAATGITAPPLEEKLIRLDGVIIDVEVSGTAIIYLGRPAVLIILRDITGRKQTENALHQSNAFNQAVLDSLAANIAVLDKAGNIIAINQAWKQFAHENGDPTLSRTGIGLNYLEICRQTTGPDAAIARVALAGIQAVLDGSQTQYSLEYPGHSPEKPGWFMMRVTPLQHEAGGVVVAHDDITERMGTEMELQQRAAQVSLINEIGGQIAAVLELDRVLERAAYLVQEMFDYHHVALFLVEGDILKLKAVAGLYSSYFPADHTQRLSEGINGWVASWGEKIVANDVSREPHYISLIASYSITQSELCLPIKVADQTVGVLDIQSPHLNSFSQNDIVAMETVANQIAIAIANARLYEQAQQEIAERKRAEEEIRQRNRELTLLNAVIATSMADLEPETLLETACRELAQAFDMPRATAVLLNDEKSEFVVAAEYSRLDPAQPQTEGWLAALGTKIPVVRRNALARFLLNCTGPVAASDAQNDPRLATIHDLLRQHGLASLLILPIRVADQVLGSLSLEALQPRLFSNEEVNLAWSVADQVASVFARARLEAERQRAEAVIRESAERFRQVISSISDHIYVSEITADGQHLNRYLSPSIETMTGYPLENFMADADFWASVVIHPDDRAVGAAQLKRLTLGQNSEIEYRMVRADGEVIWVRDSGKVETAGHSKIIYGVVSDITSRKQTEALVKQAEQRYRTLFEEAPVMYVITHNQAGMPIISDCNQLFLTTLGYTYAEVINRPLADFYSSPSRVELAADGYQRALTGQFVTQERQLITRDGRIVETLLHASPEIDVQGQVHGTRAMYVDITERKRMETALTEERASLARRVAERTAELSAANAELARTARLKDEFLANMSHELRTPLNAILGMSEVLRENIYGLLNEEQRNAVSHIEEGGRHLLELINDILDLSKIEAGKLELIVTSVSVENICQASLRFIKQLAQKKRLKISSSLDLTVITIQADERRLKQILVNLLTNAVKFTPEEGEVKLEVVGDSLNGVAHFTVQDTGIGIAKEDMERLFKPFSQLDSKLSRQHEGTGLGLSLVSRLTELHGGSVSVESVAGQGSCFTVSLPWSSQSETDKLTEIEDAASIPTSELPVKRALIIEDSPVAAGQLARYLAELNVETLIHPVGVDALQKAISLQPQIIILDLLLPDLSGWEVLSQLKLEPTTQSIPVLVASVVDERSRGLEMGAAEYLVKPVSRSQLQRVLHQILPQKPDAGQVLAAPGLKGDLLLPPQPLILLAEDNETNIKTISPYLQAKGYQLIFARDGAEAVRQAKEEQPDLILMDIQMPKMDGLEATRSIRADARLANVPIIALTALAMPGDREHCLEAGANEYISKPVSLKGLVELMERLLVK